MIIKTKFYYKSNEINLLNNLINIKNILYFKLFNDKKLLLVNSDYKTYEKTLNNIEFKIISNNLKKELRKSYLQ